MEMDSVMPVKGSRIGILAGEGKIPVLLAQSVQSMGYEAVGIAFSKEIERNLGECVPRVFTIGIGQPGKIISVLKKERIKHVVMIGKVRKELLLKKIGFDLRILKFLKTIKDKSDKTVMYGIISELEEEGFTVLEQSSFLRNLFPEKGVLTNRHPTTDEYEDVKFGLQIAKKMAGLEVGQTVVIKDKIILSVEAVEGTDEAIKRGCILGGKGSVVIKVSRPDQDQRFDIPAVGAETIHTMKQGRASVLAIEAEKMFLANRDICVHMADNAGISIIAV